jgi:hypothetical protein
LHRCCFPNGLGFAGQHSAYSLACAAAKLYARSGCDTTTPPRFLSA